MTQPFQSSKFLIEAGPVNWYEPHAKAVAERNAQEDKARVEKEAQTAQKLKVLKEEDPILKLAAVSKTIMAAGKLLKQTQAGKDKKALEENKEIQAFIQRHPRIGKDFSALYKRDKNLKFSEENDVYKGWKTDLLARDDGHIYKPLFQQLESLSTRRQVALQEAVAIRHGQEISAPAYFATVGIHSTHLVDGKPVPLYSDKQKEQYIESKDKATWEQEYVAGQIKKMGFDDKFVQKFMAGELDRRFKTRRNIQSALNSKSYNESTRATMTGLLKTNLSSVDGGDWIDTIVNQSIEGASNFKDIVVDGKVYTALQQSADEVFDRFQQLNGAGFVPQLALSQLNAYEFDHPAGPGGKGNLLNTLFGGDAKKLKQIISVNNQGQKYYLSTQTANDQAELQSISRLASQGVDVTQRLNTLESRGLLKKEDITRVRDTDVSAQSDEAFNNTLSIWLPKLEVGLQGVDSQEVDDIPNDKARTFIQARFKQLKDAESTVGTQVGNMDGDIHRSYSKNPYKAGETELSTTGKLIKRRIDHAGSSYRAQLIWSQYDATGKKVNPIDDIDYKVAQYKKGLWESGGGGEKGNDKQGIYAVDDKGRFRNFETAMAFKEKIGKEFNIPHDGTIEGMKTSLISHLNTNHKIDGEYDYKGFVESGILGKAEIVSWLTSGGGTTDWMAYISGMTGVSVSDIVMSSIDKIIEEDPAFAKRWQLDKYVNSTPDAFIMKRFGERFSKFDQNQNQALGASDLRFLLKKGIKNLTPNQLKRLQKTLDLDNNWQIFEKERQQFEDTVATQRRIEILEEADAARNREIFTKPKAPPSFETVNEPIIEPTLNLKDLPQLEFDNQEDGQNIEFNTEPFISK